ncbi:hypothetical protein SAMN05443633_108130 [Chryseobacterium arachidis]|uniref:Uncharacterized protein n=1 Tax=Chryseobacterium arachidis TaxID=1416778 RepID=A0A1M5FU90_9FLAO|nr:hypothetical protein [Chryseobacterium arachidis]SHF94742.1 hypothetical protein SAMN05443633_108130 [Chryseobacterium arachidis]
MKKALYIFLIFISGMLSAQKNQPTKLVVCNDAVGTVKLFDEYKNQTEKVNVFKTKASLPSNLKKFGFLADNGLTEIKLKKNASRPDMMSLEMLNEQYGLPKNTTVFIDGYQFDHPEINIYSEIIINGKIVDSDGRKSLHISTVDN